MRSLGYSKKTASSSSSIVLEDNGRKIFDPFNVARIFNHFYSTVASNLVSKLPDPFGIFDVSSNVF